MRRTALSSASLSDGGFRDLLDGGDFGSMTTPRALRTLRRWDDGEADADEDAASSEDEGSEEEEKAKADEEEEEEDNVAEKTAWLQRAMATAAAEALKACAARDGDSTDDDEASEARRAKRRNARNRSDAREASVALLEAAVVSSSLYLVDGGDDHAAAVGAGREAAFWLRALCVGARALRFQSAKKAMRRGDATINAVTLERCAAAAAKDAHLNAMEKDVAYVAYAAALGGLAKLRAGVNAPDEADVDPVTVSLSCCALMDLAGDDARGPGASLALDRRGAGARPAFPPERTSSPPPLPAGSRHSPSPSATPAIGF